MHAQTQTDNRATTSCTECQRRKQKCSREWPCNHCQARKVAHLCHFAVKKTLQQPVVDPARDNSSEIRGHKRRHPVPSEGSAGPLQTSKTKPYEGLRDWGYMPGHVHWKVSTADDGAQTRSASPEAAGLDVVDRVLYAVPPRSITDAFVNHFLSVVNYRYSSIYAPTFTNQYVQWWAARAAGKRLSPEFTCLLLRVCAYSVQYLTPSLRRMIEFELACNLQQLTYRFSEAAEHLSQSFTASETCIERVQEQFLKGAWLKSESQIIESWHALGCTIREAQELGIDNDNNIESLTEFEIEIRRRIWALLYIWDWQMGAWLGRPNLIDQKNVNFRLPNLRLDSSSSEPNLLSPFAHVALQASLARRLSTIMGDAQSVDALSANKIIATHAEIDKFIDELPPIFRLHDSDTSLDPTHPYFVFQRHQLHTVLFVTKLDFLKPFLTRARDEKKTERDDEFRAMGIDLALDVLTVARRLFDHEFPINAKFHMVVFSIFDTSTILCSAIIHDRESRLPRRDEVMNALDESLDMLHQLSGSSKLGASSYIFLYKLIQSHPELSRGAEDSKRARQLISTSTHTPQPPPLVHSSSSKESIDSSVALQASGLAAVISQTSAPIQSASTMPFARNSSFGADQLLTQNPLGSASALDLGGMEQIWAWEDLNLDQYPC